MVFKSPRLSIVYYIIDERIERENVIVGRTKGRGGALPIKCLSPVWRMKLAALDRAMVLGPLGQSDKPMNRFGRTGCFPGIKDRMGTMKGPELACIMEPMFGS